MTSEQPYPSSAAVDTAIKDAARNARKRDPSRNVSNMIRQACFDRFLCRVFSDGANSEWVLKGGTGMLARIPSTRATLDVDLYHNGFTLDQALEDLKRLVAVDLGDHFRFVYDSHVSAVEGQAQPYTDGYRVTFIPYLGARELPSFHVDLAIGAGVTAPIETTAPANRLHLPRLVTTDYRLYPIVDQIADKVCATMATYNGAPSSREKDLVDLVVIATTYSLDAASLAAAIAIERRRRRLELFTHFTIPTAWGPSYTKMARTIPACANHQAIDTAAALAQRLLDPVLNGDLAKGTWDSIQLAWN